MSDLHVFKCDVGGVIDWVVAASADDAAAVMTEHSGESWGEDKPAWLQLPDTEEIRITIEGEGKVTRACAEWARETGRGLLASTEF